MLPIMGIISRATIPSYERDTRSDLLAIYDASHNEALGAGKRRSYDFSELVKEQRAYVHIIHCLAVPR
jgi:hypothetical protein